MNLLAFGLIGLFSVTYSFATTDASPLADEIAPTPRASTKAVRRLIRRLGRSLGMPINIRLASKGHARVHKDCAVVSMVCLVPKNERGTTHFFGDTKKQIDSRFCLGTCFYGKDCELKEASPSNCAYVTTGNGFTCKTAAGTGGECKYKPTPCNLLIANTKNLGWTHADTEAQKKGIMKDVGHCGEAWITNRYPKDEKWEGAWPVGPHASKDGDLAALLK